MYDKATFNAANVDYAMRNKEKNLYRRLLKQNRFELSLLIMGRGNKHPWLYKTPVKAITILDLLFYPLIVLVTALLFLLIIKRIRRHGSP